MNARSKPERSKPTLEEQMWVNACSRAHAEGFRQGVQAAELLIALLAELPSIVRFAELGDLNPLRNFSEAIRALRPEGEKP